MGAGEHVSGRRSALLVAAYDYDDPKLARLRAPPHDVEALHRVLADPTIGGYDVRVLVNESHGMVLEEIEDFFADRKPDDLLLLYFSCHGVKDLTGRLYFATSSTKLSRLGSTGLSSAWINEQLDRSRSRRVVVLLDCCYSGAFAKGLAPRSGPSVAVSESLGGRGRAVIAASDAMEYAWEDDVLTLEDGQSSLFTRAVVTGLETGDADRDADGEVAVDELYDYVYERVREATPHQTPTKSSYGEQGDLIIARNPNPPAPPVEPEPLPLELDSALHDRRTWIRRAAITELQALRLGDRPGLAISAERALQHMADNDEEPDVQVAAAAALASSLPTVDEGQPGGHDSVGIESAPVSEDVAQRNFGAEPVSGTSLEARLATAQEAFRSARWTEAINRFEALTSDYPDDKSLRERLTEARRQHVLAAWFSEAEAAETRGDWDTAIDALEQIIAQDAAYGDARKLLRRYRARRDRARQTRQLLNAQQKLRDNPQSKRAAVRGLLAIVPFLFWLGIYAIPLAVKARRHKEPEARWALFIAVSGPLLGFLILVSLIRSW